MRKAVSKFEFLEPEYGTEDLDTLMARIIDRTDFDPEENDNAETLDKASKKRK